MELLVRDGLMNEFSDQSFTAFISDMFRFSKKLCEKWFDDMTRQATKPGDVTDTQTRKSSGEGLSSFRWCQMLFWWLVHNHEQNDLGKPVPKA